MVSLVRLPPLDLSDFAPEGARAAIRELLEADPGATRRIYAALARKVWALLVERRFDPELRDWHSLLQAVKAKIKSSDEAAAERLVALSDLVKESVSFAELSPAKEAATRPRGRQILDHLALTDQFTKRKVLLEKLGIGSSHLSNVLTHLIAHDLIERRGSGKEAEFKITRRGKSMIGLEDAAPAPELRIGLELERLFGDLKPNLPVVDLGSVNFVRYTNILDLTGVMTSDEHRSDSPYVALPGFGKVQHDFAITVGR